MTSRLLRIPAAFVFGTLLLAGTTFGFAQNIAPQAGALTLASDPSLQAITSTPITAALVTASDPPSNGSLLVPAAAALTTAQVATGLNTAQVAALTTAGVAALKTSQIAAMTEEPPRRITRRFLTPPFHDVHALLRGRENLFLAAQHGHAA